MGRWDDGAEQFRKTFEIAPNFVQGHYYWSQAYAWRGSYREALAELEKIEPPDSVPVLGLRRIPTPRRAGRETRFWSSTN